MLRKISRQSLALLHWDSAIARNSIFLLSAEAIRTAVNFFLSALLGRYLQPEGLGIFKFVVNFTILFAVMTDAGISRVAVRRMARAPLTQHNSIHGLLFSARLILSFAAFTILVASLAILPSSQVHTDVRFLCAIYMWSQMFQAFRKNPEVVWQARQQLHYHAYFAISNRVLMLVGVTLAVVFRAPLWFIICTYVAVDFLDCAAANWYLYRNFSKPQWPASKRPVMSLLREALPFGLQNLAQQLRYYFDVVLMKFLFTNAGSVADRQIGLYASATPFVLSLLFIPTSFAGAVYPELARTFLADRKHFCKLTAATLTLLYLVASSLALLLYFGRTLLIPLTYGKNFSPAIPLLGILAWMLPGIFLNTGLLVVYAAADRQNILTNANWAAALGKIFLSWLLIPKLGAVGAALAGIISETVITVVLLGILVITLPSAFSARGFAAITLAQGLYFLACTAVQSYPYVLAAFVTIQALGATIGAYFALKHFREKTKTSEIASVT
ncbi:MAG: flippase [Candidatus Sumerlaeaceae bacterium]